MRAGEAVLCRQWVSVHLVDDEHVAAHRPASGDGVGEAVGGLEGDVDHVGPELCLLEEGAQAHALPPGVAYQVAADHVANALQGHVLLHGQRVLQVVVGQRHRVVDEAGNLQLPAVHVYSWVYLVFRDDVEERIRRDLGRKAA